VAKNIVYVGPAENFAIFDIIRNFCTPFIYLINFPLDCIKTRWKMPPSLVAFCSAFIVDEKFLFADMLSCSKSYALLTDGGRRI